MALNSIPGMAEWLRGYLAGKNVGRFVLCGHSMGAALSLYYAVTWPQDLLGLVAVDGTSKISAPFSAPGGLAALAQDIDSYRQRLEVTFARLETEERNALIVRMMDVGVPGRLADMTAINAFDLTNRVGDIRAPTLVIAGSEDPAGLAKFEALTASIQGARIKVIAGAGHYPMLDRPDDFNCGLKQFVEEIEDSGVNVSGEGDGR